MILAHMNAIAHVEAWKILDFNGVWTRDLVIPVRRSNQLGNEATDVGKWLFVGSNEPVWSYVSHRYREVTGSNPVEVLNFSGFYCFTYAIE